jgi:hypothetical protein
MKSSFISHLFFVVVILIFPISCNRKDTKPDPTITISEFLRDLEFRGVKIASSYFVGKPRIPFSDFGHLYENADTNFKKWQDAFEGEELVAYCGLSPEIARDFLQNHADVGIMTGEDFTENFRLFSFSDCQVSKSEYIKESEEKEFEAYGYANMTSNVDGLTTPVGRWYIKITSRYGNKGWKITQFYAYDESRKGLF